MKKKKLGVFWYCRLAAHWTVDQVMLGVRADCPRKLKLASQDSRPLNVAVLLK